MKIVFEENDSIYKIVYTIKKIPNYKKAIIHINENHSIFKHPRWGTYLKKIIQEHHINVTFFAKNYTTKQYFDEAWLTYHHESFFEDWFSKLSLQTFMKSITTFHKQLLLKKTNLSILILFAEFLILVSLVYIFRTLISPNATIYVSPSYSIENIVYNFRYYPKKDEAVHTYQAYLSIPYATWSLPFISEMSTHVQNMTSSQESARWTVTLFNTLPFDFSLLKKTKLITDNWVEFTLDEKTKIPKWSNDTPWKIEVKVTAKERYESWELIWDDWNIPKWKLLLVKNLSESTEDGSIRAEASRWFTNGKLIEKWTVIKDDIKNIEQDLLKKMESEKGSFIKSHHKDKETILLPFEELTSFDINWLVTTSELWQEASFVEWKVETTIFYPVISWNDIEQWVFSYLDQRAEDTIFTNTINRDWIVFYDYIFIEATEKLPAHYIIPTRVPILKKYDINHDWLGIIKEIKDRIIWIDKNEAKNIILSYPEIEKAEIKISPRRYAIIPDITSRVTFKFQE